MRYIKNYDQLATNPSRKIVLDLVEAAIDSIQPGHVLKQHFSLQGNLLTIQSNQLNLNNFKRVFLLGFGKGSAGAAQILEQTLGNFLTAGWVIDTVEKKFKKCQFALGTHPLPSQQNFDFTKHVLEQLANLTAQDLVIILTFGGGSALLEYTHSLTLADLINLEQTLLKAGDNIAEMNTVRKHLSEVKGGNLAKQLFPATVFNLIFSDVPGNDLSIIASGPTVKDESTVKEAKQIFAKYNLETKFKIAEEHLHETPKEGKYFEKIHNLLILSNLTALQAMQSAAEEAGIKSVILSSKFQGVAKEAGQELIAQTSPHSLLLAGGETTVKVTGKGSGGRNQELVLGALDFLDENTTIVSFDSDGWDNSEAAGAIGDQQTLTKAKKLNLDPKNYLDQNNSLAFFTAIADTIITDRLSSNVSDLMLVYKQ